ncbi:MAG: 30S ribosomal protein S9 [candidate division TM6 bacterium GW2011_GWF2_38_10]|nr:MAG: 30S ribosomal protein S9 [candidate division TM6 bacterium GW2011_GWF2_38_10]
MATQKASYSSNATHGVGRRKSSVARVWAKPGKGSITVNGKDFKQYFDTELSLQKVLLPLKVTGLTSSTDIMVNIFGGGLKSQAGATQLGIARALLASNEDFRKVLRQNDLLTVDSRVKERKKYGQKAARRKFQFVKR